MAQHTEDLSRVEGQHEVGCFKLLESDSCVKGLASAGRDDIAVSRSVDVAIDVP